MHYFQFEIKEWISNTAHLSLEEECAYLRLIFYYYDSETYFSEMDLDVIFRKCRIPPELGKSILVEFFEWCDDDWGYWFHKRCDAEIAKYRAKKDQASRAGKLSAERRSNARSTDVQPIINHKSIITNHKPDKKEVEPPDGVSADIWRDYMTLRRSKKAPVTKTALRGLEREADRAGISLQDVLSICCERGWIGFKADWIKDGNLKTVNSPQLAAARSIFGDERGLPNALKTIA